MITYVTNVSLIITPRGAKQQVFSTPIGHHRCSIFAIIVIITMLCRFGHQQRQVKLLLYVSEGFLSCYQEDKETQLWHGARQK